MADETLKYQRRMINGWWILGVLTFLLILSITMFFVFRCICVDIILTYISFASTLLSITLSIFAIAYTYTSNNQVNRQFEKINHAAQEITETSQKLNDTEVLLKNNLSIILKVVDEVKLETITIRNQVSNFNVKNENPPNLTEIGKENMIGKVD